MKGTKRCPQDFQITPELRAWAREKVPDVDIDAETEALRDHEFARAHSDWPAVWRNWMRREQKAVRRFKPKSKFERNGGTSYAEVMAALDAAVDPDSEDFAP
nr:MAG: hypothetical protein DIU57_14260 [Pseudomonadota bacterium]